MSSVKSIDDCITTHKVKSKEWVWHQHVTMNSIALYKGIQMTYAVGLNNILKNLVAWQAHFWSPLSNGSCFHCNMKISDNIMKLLYSNCQPEDSDLKLHKASYYKISHNAPRHKIGHQSFPIALKFGRHLVHTAAKAPAKFQNDMRI